MFGFESIFEGVMNYSSTEEAFFHRITFPSCCKIFNLGSVSTLFNDRILMQSRQVSYCLKIFYKSSY